MIYFSALIFIICFFYFWGWRGSYCYLGAYQRYSSTSLLTLPDQWLRKENWESHSLWFSGQSRSWLGHFSEGCVKLSKICSDFLKCVQMLVLLSCKQKYLLIWIYYRIIFLIGSRITKPNFQFYYENKMKLFK